MKTNKLYLPKNKYLLFKLVNNTKYFIKQKDKNSKSRQNVLALTEDISKAHNFETLQIAMLTNEFLNNEFEIHLA